MNGLNIAFKFCQVSWVVKDINAAEKFFIGVMGVEKFFHMKNLSAADTQGTYLGKPGNWVCDLYMAYSGDTQIELIQPISGESMYTEAIQKHGDSVQHIAYWLDETEYDEACQSLESLGYPMIQSLILPAGKIGYFDTRPVIGIVTEIIGSTKEGYEFIDNLKSGNF